MWPFDVVLDAVNNIVYILQNLFYLFLYPLVVLIEDLYSIFSYIYSVFAVYINITIESVNLVLYILNVLVGAYFLNIWLSLIVIQISISSGVRVYNFIRHIKTWLPTWGN